VKEQIRAGEAFQVVISQRFEAECPADPLDVYRVLRATNPSPYMYLLRLESAGTSTQPARRFDIVGSSPEALVTVRDGKATTHPIAGTRWRGATEEEDLLLEKELRSDEKERAEHVMLVDLGRNDLGRVCEAGTVKVHSFFSVERYSHVMHLVSTVTGTLRRDCNAFDAVVACFPAGTLSGAPKPRALQIIEELEPTRRGLYGGIVGYLDFAGDADTAIAIRTAVVRDGIAYVQAGGGIVADSDPAAEDTESLNKARAVLAAVATAATLAKPRIGTDTAATPGPPT
jgi:anthranilate synthase component I